MKRLPVKGQPGYVDGTKKRNIRNSLIGTAAFIGLYVIGYVINGSNANYLTVAAMLAILPTAQFMTKAFAYGRYYSVDGGFAQEVARLTDKASVLDEIILVRKKNTFFFEHILATQDHVLAVADKRPPKMGKSKAARDDAAEKTLAGLFRQQGLSVNVKCFKDEQALLDFFKEKAKPALQHKDEAKLEALLELVLRNAM